MKGGEVIDVLVHATGLRSDSIRVAGQGVGSRMLRGDSRAASSRRSATLAAHESLSRASRRDAAQCRTHSPASRHPAQRARRRTGRKGRATPCRVRPRSDSDQRLRRAPMPPRRRSAPPQVHQSRSSRCCASATSAFTAARPTPRLRSTFPRRTTLHPGARACRNSRLGSATPGRRCAPPRPARARPDRGGLARARVPHAGTRPPGGAARHGRRVRAVGECLPDGDRRRDRSPVGDRAARLRGASRRSRVPRAGEHEVRVAGRGAARPITHGLPRGASPGSARNVTDGRDAWPPAWSLDATGPSFRCRPSPFHLARVHVRRPRCRTRMT